MNSVARLIYIVLAAKKWTIRDLAKELDMSIIEVYNMLDCNAPLNKTLELGLERVSGLPAKMWVKAFAKCKK